MVLLPLLNPRLEPLNIALHLICIIACKLHYYLFIVGIARFLQENFYDFRVEVLLEFGFGVISMWVSIT